MQHWMPDSLACVTLQATVITFSNKSPFRVRALWIDFSGNEVGVVVHWAAECMEIGL